MKPINTAYIVDDDRVYLFTTRRTLLYAKLCQNLHVFENGRDALLQLEKDLEYDDNLPDIILLDLNMPVMDGWEFLEAFTHLRPNLAKPVTVFMLTSSVRPEDEARAAEFSELSGFAVKPLTEESFVELFAQAAQEADQPRDS